MNREQDNEFEDPALKAALRRSFAGERAPESLRQRVLAAQAECDSTIACASAGSMERPHSGSGGPGLKVSHS